MNFPLIAVCQNLCNICPCQYAQWNKFLYQSQRLLFVSLELKSINSVTKLQVNPNVLFQGSFVFPGKTNGQYPVKIKDTPRGLINIITISWLLVFNHVFSEHVTTTLHLSLFISFFPVFRISRVLNCFL